MRFRMCFAFLFCVSACASMPVPPELSRSSALAPAPASHPRIQFVSAQTGSRQPPIGKTDLEQARALLFQARNDLEPRQWEALAGRLTAAERAFERFSQATQASGQAAEVGRGVGGLSQAGRSMTWVEVLPRVGPLLVFLVLLYPSSTAGPEIDHRPEWVNAQREYVARLQELAEESRRLIEERVSQHAEEVVPDFDLDLVAAATAPTPWWKKLKKAPRSKNVEKLDKVPCSRVRLPLDAMKGVLEKRWEIEKECFGGKPDPGHDITMTELEQGIKRTEKLEKRNCTPGHPMAEW